MSFCSWKCRYITTLIISSSTLSFSPISQTSDHPNKVSNFFSLQVICWSFCSTFWFSQLYFSNSFTDFKFQLSYFVSKFLNSVSVFVFLKKKTTLFLFLHLISARTLIIVLLHFLLLITLLFSPVWSLFLFLLVSLFCAGEVLQICCASWLWSTKSWSSVYEDWG